MHPIYVLLVNPVGSFLLNFLSPAVNDNFVGILINSLTGALGFLGAFLLFQSMNTRFGTALLLALIFAFSMSQMANSVIPETYTAATLSLLLTYSLFFQDLYLKKMPFWVWVIIGMFTMGILITNFAQTLICYAIIQWRRAARSQKQKGLILQIIKYSFTVGAIVGVLALLQKWIYPSSDLFFSPSKLAYEKNFISWTIFERPWLVIQELLKNFLVFNVVGPFPRIARLRDGFPMLTYSFSWGYGLYGYVVLLGYLGLALIGKRLDVYKEYSWFYLGLAICFLFNLGLHSFYGVRNENIIEFFLYSGNLTFILLIFLFGNYRIGVSNLKTILLSVFLFGLLLNNLLVFQQIWIYFQ